MRPAHRLFLPEPLSCLPRFSLLSPADMKSLIPNPAQGYVACTPPPAGYGHAPRTDVPAWLLSPPAGPPPTLDGQTLPAAAAPGAAGPSPGPRQTLPQRSGAPTSPALRLPTKLPGGKPSPGPGPGPAAAPHPPYHTPHPPRPGAAPPLRAAGPPRFPPPRVPAAPASPSAGRQRVRDHQSTRDHPPPRKPHAPSAGAPVSARGAPAPSPARQRLTPGRLVLPTARPATGPSTRRPQRAAPGALKEPWLHMPGGRLSDAPGPGPNLEPSRPMPARAAAAWAPRGFPVARGHHVGALGTP